MPKLPALLLMLLVYYQSSAADTLVIRSLTKPVSIGPCISTLKDPGGRLTIHDVMARTGEFRSVDREVPVYANEDSYVWVRLVAINATGRNLWLWVANCPTDTVYFYERSAQGMVTRIAGDKVPFHTRDLKSNRILFQVSNTTSPVEIFVRLNIRIPRQFPIYLTTADALVEWGNATAFTDGIFYGLLILIIIYNLLLWSTMRRRFYLYYIGYIFFAGLLLLHIDGFGYAYLWTDYPAINDHPAIMAVLPMFFALLFVGSFLDLRHKHPPLMNGLWIFSVLLLLITALSLLGFKFLSLNLAQVAAFTAVVYFLVPGVVLYRRGYQPARYYLAAWSILLTGLLVFLLMFLGVLNYDRFTLNALKLGISFESLLMAFAVVDSINFFRKQKKRLETEKAMEHEQRKKAEEELRAAEQVLRDYTVRLMNKNALIEKFSEDLHRLEQKLEAPGENDGHLQALMEATILTDDDWRKFRVLFDKVYGGYIYRLREKYSSLTETDIRLLSLMKLRMSTHDMANMLGVSVDAIRKSKQRLRKKVQLAPEANFEELLSVI